MKSEGIARFPETIELTGIRRSNIYLKINPDSKYYDPSFPKPVKLSARSIGWRRSELNAWISGLNVA
jgi:prophage regulatory protein